MAGQLQIFEQIRPWIFRIQLCQLSQEFFRLLVSRHRHRYLHFHNFVTSNAFFGCRGHTFFAQTKFLSRLCSRRNLQQGATINCRHFDLRAQSGFCCGDRNYNMNVLAFAAKHWVAFRPNNYVEIAWLAAAGAGVAFASKTNALAIACACLDANLERLGAVDHAFSVTYRASRNIFAGAVAARARHIELHAPASLFDRTFAFALRADARLLNDTISVAIPANVLAGDVQTHDAATNRRPERNIDLVFEVAPGF